MRCSLTNKIITRLSIAAGMMIGIGATVKLSCNNPIIGTFLFSVGLFYICSQGMYLFTGKIGYINKNNVKTYPLIWLYNFIGVAIICLPIRIVNPSLHIAAMNLLEPKMIFPWYRIAIMSFYCGIVMYLAVDTSNKFISGSIKTFSIVIGVAVFILSGYEHSIANMAYAIFFITYNSIWFCLKLIIISTLFNGIGSIFIRYLMKGNLKINVESN